MLSAVDTIPDVVETATNVTAELALATIVVLAEWMVRRMRAPVAAVTA